MAIQRTFEDVKRVLGEDWNTLTLPEQNEIRNEWVARLVTASNKVRDPAFRKSLEDEAFADAPEFARPYQPSWKERHPSLYAAGATAVGTPMKVLETPQQIVANLLDPILKGKRYPATFGGILAALKEPFQKTGEWMGSQREETELPGGGVTRMVTDPLMYTGLGELAATRMAARAAPPGVKMLPLGRKAAEKIGKIFMKPGLEQWVGEIPRSWATWDQPNRQLYSQIMQMGQQYIPKDQLQRVAETIVNVGPEQGAQAVKILREGNTNRIRSLVSWAEMPSWSRKVLKGGKKAAQAGVADGEEVGGAAKTVVEEASQPGDWANYLQKMMETPTL